MKGFNVYFSVQTDDNVTMGDIEKKLLEIGQVFNISIQAQSVVYPQTTMPPYPYTTIANVNSDSSDSKNDQKIPEFDLGLFNKIFDNTQNELKNIKDKYKNDLSGTFVVASFKEDKILISSGEYGYYNFAESFVNKAYQFKSADDAIDALEKTLGKRVTEVTEDECKARDVKECYKVVKMSSRGHLLVDSITYCIF